MEIYNKLEQATITEDVEERNTLLNEGMELITQRNKVLTDKYGWETAMCYGTDPVASDSEDEKRIKRARKEAKVAREEKLKSKNLRLKPAAAARSKRPFRNYYKGTQNGGFPALPYTRYEKKLCWRCGKPGHTAKHCKAPTPGNFGTRPWGGLKSPNSIP